MAKDEDLKESNEQQLHWFWKLTTKWWFFPVFYVVLSIPLGFPFSVYFMPMGLLTWVWLFSRGTNLVYAGTNIHRFLYSIWGLDEDEFINSILAIMAILYIAVIYYKYKHNKILRLLIILLLLLIILSFSGCVAGQYFGINFIGAI